MTLDTIHTNDSDTLSVRAASIRLGVGRTKVYQLLNSGVITAFKVGRRTLIHRKSVESFIEHRATPYRCSSARDVQDSHNLPGSDI